MPPGHTRQEIGRRWRNEDQIMIACKPDVPDFALVVEVEEIRQNALVGESADGKRRDELMGSLRHNGANGMAAVSETTDQFEAFISRDAAADDQKDAFG